MRRLPGIHCVKAAYFDSRGPKRPPMTGPVRAGTPAYDRICAASTSEETAGLTCMYMTSPAVHPTMR